MKMAMATPTAATAMPPAIRICVLPPSGDGAEGEGEVVGEAVVGWLDTRTVRPVSC